MCRTSFLLYLRVVLIATASYAYTQGTCLTHDVALTRLAMELSSGAAISCRGYPLEYDNSERYWGRQYGRSASVVVFPVTAEDVSHAVRASAHTHIGHDLAFVSGGHGQTNASSSTGFVIDLSWLNASHLLQNVTIDDTTIATAVAYQGGAIWSQVQSTTNGTGHTAIGARVGNVGAGGFSTGGGIGFLAGAHGYAIDRLRAVEVVLMSGEIVIATKTNTYADLFWALQGGGGQFGIVTTFYQEAVPEPEKSRFGIWLVSPESWSQAQENVVRFFDENKDPFSLIYYAVGYFPDDLQSGPLGLRMLIVAVQFSDPLNTKQQNFNATFSALISELSIDHEAHYELPYADATSLCDGFFPYGYRRGFWGAQTTNITAEYLSQATNEFVRYVQTLLSKGEMPLSATWVLQYMYPGLNGNLPPSDHATAWPHSVSAHQTLFSPAWQSAYNDDLAFTANAALNELTWDHQASLGVSIADYPNYISPGVQGRRVWGQNVERLIRVKEKYDPLCRIHLGKVFASTACTTGGWANIFP